VESCQCHTPSAYISHRWVMRTKNLLKWCD
jgi:hypothetical protein